MANLSDLTRKEQVLARLRAESDNPMTQGWVDGNELANEEVGGSEGLRRVRELKLDGYLIQERAHPDKTRAIHQYRIVVQTTVMPERASTPPVEAPNGPARVAGPYGTPGGAYRQPGKAKEERYKDWELVSGIRGEYKAEWWIREPKQRIIGTIALDFDRSRWFWGVRRPAYNGQEGQRDAMNLGAGTIPVLPGSTLEERERNMARAKQAAREAVEFRVRELKEADSL